jgi:DNA-binding NtrC family response regulator
VTAFGTISSAVEAIKLGAYDYLTKPIVDDELRIALERATRQQALQAENIELKARLERQERYGAIVGRDEKMHRVFELIEAVAGTSTTVLVTGESGTGKSMVARTIHKQSDRRDGPFVEVSCGALPETLLESELFGHVKGAFTGAVADKPGRFLAADGGTIFLDEIDSAPASLQVKLLRVLQERQLEQVGANRTQTVDVRVIVATNKNLRNLVAKGAFREDLFYRVNVVEIRLPALRERLGDIRLLAENFFERFRAAHQKMIGAIAPATFDLLERHGWPGNVRELENVIERAVVLTRNSQLLPADLPAEVLAGTSEVRPIDRIVSSGAMAMEDEPILPMMQAMLAAEKRILTRALHKCGGNRRKTCELLGISRTSLFRKMRDHDLLEESEKE